MLEPVLTPHPLVLHRQSSSIVYVGIITGGDIPTSSQVHNCLHYLETLPLPHSSPRNIDLPTLSSTLHVSWYILLWHAHRDASGPTRDIACDKFGVPGFTILAALHRAAAIGDQRETQIRHGAATDERRPQELEASRRNEVRKHFACAAGPPRRRRLQEAGGTATSTHLLQCHGANPTATSNDAFQANRSRRAPPCPPHQTIVAIPSTPARRAETRTQQASILGCFWNEGLTVSIPFQRLGGQSSTLFASPPAPSNPVPPGPTIPSRGCKFLTGDENTRSWPGKVRVCGACENN